MLAEREVMDYNIFIPCSKYKVACRTDVIFFCENQKKIKPVLQANVNGAKLFLTKRKENSE